jgi:hypothetical protein
MEGGDVELLFHGYRVFHGADEKVLEMEGGMITQQCELLNITESYTYNG